MPPAPRRLLKTMSLARQRIERCESPGPVQMRRQWQTAASASSLLRYANRSHRSCLSHPTPFIRRFEFKLLTCTYSTTDGIGGGLPIRSLSASCFSSRGQGFCNQNHGGRVLKEYAEIISSLGPDVGGPRFASKLRRRERLPTRMELSAGRVVNIGTKFPGIILRNHSIEQSRSYEYQNPNQSDQTGRT
jgi:hypothetical protein